MQPKRGADVGSTRQGKHRPHRRSSLGIGLYLFDYKPEFRDAWGHGRQLGVMADEVEAVMPNAVSVRADGYRTVDYGCWDSPAPLSDVGLRSAAARLESHA